VSNGEFPFNHTVNLMSVAAQTKNELSLPEARDGHQGAVLGTRRILLVEEQAHVLRVIRLNLERCGYLVDAVLSADLALQHIRLHHYDALILTSDLPEITSGELCQRIVAMLGGSSAAMPEPLMLVSYGEGVERLADEVENRVSLSRPVSLKLIVARLDEYFNAPAIPDAECH
jgi:CheY-like chemotaxis protein